MKVDFIIIGSMKSGTTTLATILQQHEKIRFSTPKEPQFFSKARDWRKELDRYHGYFEEKEGVIYGEGSTSYTKYPHFNLSIWEDIYEYNPAMKFIYIVRNPCDRAVSHYMHIFERGFTRLDFEKALIKETAILDCGRYYTQVKPYIDRFGTSQVLIIDFDDLTNDPASVVQTVADFLQVDYNGFEEIKNVHSNKSTEVERFDKYFDNPDRMVRLAGKVFPRPIRRKIWDKIKKRSSRSITQKPILTEQMRKMIIRMMDLEIDGLERLTGRDFSKWRK